MKSLKISSFVLYALFAISAVVLGLFFFVGYDTPYEENPTKNAPDFTDLLMLLMYAFVAVAAIVTIISAVMSIFTSSGTGTKGIAGHTGLIAIIVLIVAIVVGMIVSGADTEDLLINGTAFEHKDHSGAYLLTNVSIVAAGILGACAVIATIIGMVTKK